MRPAKTCTANMINPYRGHCFLFIILVCLTRQLGAQTITSSEYFPLADGNYWTYLVNNSYESTTRVLSGAYLVNGIPTQALRYSSDGYTEYYTSDNNGVRLHRVYYPEYPQITATFEPPILLAGPSPSIGSTVRSTGTARTYIPDASPTPYLINYDATSNITALETITVPAGIFDTVKNTFTLRIYGTIQTPAGSIFLDESVNQTLWAAHFVGPVRQIVTDSLGTSDAVMTSTNVEPPAPAKPRPRSLPWLPLLLE